MQAYKLSGTGKKTTRITKNYKIDHVFKGICYIYMGK
jgi:hypothetical protein